MVLGKNAMDAFFCGSFRSPLSSNQQPNLCAASEVRMPPHGLPYRRLSHQRPGRVSGTGNRRSPGCRRSHLDRMGDRFPEVLPRNRITIAFESSDQSPEQRIVYVRFCGHESRPIIVSLVPTDLHRTLGLQSCIAPPQSIPSIRD